jgi:predicted regulator of Ras-like GTPase activity (Roadblock/LC7/MglB family)
VQLAGKPAVPAAPAVPKAVSADVEPQASAPIAIPVASIWNHWPEAAKAALSNPEFASASLELPAAELEKGLRAGAVKYPWIRLCTFIRPLSARLAAALPADTELELPLSVLAPAFLAQHRPTRAQRKVAIAENIPDLFAGKAPTVGSATVPTAGPVSAPAATPAPATAQVQAPPPAPQPPAYGTTPAQPLAAAPKPSGSFGQLVGQPDKQEWSPNEVVKAALRLPGVAGVLVGAHDGMLLAGQMPTGLNPQTVAAFLPQVFGRLSQYGVDMNLKPGNRLVVTFGEQPLLIVKTGTLFLAAVGQAGQTLPDHELKLAATALGS